MTADEFSQSEDGKAMASAHDHSHGRPPAACVDPVADVCPYLPPAPCVRAMEDSAPASAPLVSPAAGPPTPAEVCPGTP